MSEMIRKEIERRFNETTKCYIFITLKKTKKTVCIDKDTNMWTNETFYNISYVEKDANEYVTNASHISHANSLEEVAQIIEKIA